MTAGDARKLDIATAVNEACRVWFTLAHGGLDEIFYPRPDRVCVRALRLGIGGVADEDMEHACRRPDEVVPLLVVETQGAPYAMTKETIADTRSNAVLQHVRWGSGERLRVELVLERKAVDLGPLDHFGQVVLAADLDGHAVALAASAPWAAPCDGLVGELAGDDVTLVLGFGETCGAAAHVAVAAVQRGFAVVREQYVAEWREWYEKLGRRSSRPLWVRSACVLKTLEAKHIDGGRVAALAKPWGRARSPEDSGSYHLVWTRDLVETIGGMIAAGAHDEARESLTFLGVTQRQDGHWPQNMKLDGERVWRGEESDETALPIVLVELLLREGLIGHHDLEHAWPLILRAAERLTSTGPSTCLDRWEDTPGVTPFTIAAEIAALRIASELAVELGHPLTAHRFTEIADRWDLMIDDVLYRRGGPLADRLGIPGYYVRARVPGQPFPMIDPDHVPKTELSPDALALVRFGVRSPDDPRIAHTVQAIDAVLRTGAGWRRYPGDSYGEQADGAPWDGEHGIGRSWPLFVGERGHYELARGNIAAAEQLCEDMARLAGPTGMLPEQSWDAADVPDRELSFGQPTHSAAPLGWAHAEYVKLCRSLSDGHVFDLPMRWHSRCTRSRVGGRDMTLEVRDDPVKTVDVRTPTYAPPPPTTVRTEPETSTVGLMRGGASLEAIGGAGAIVLSILGLAGFAPFLMTTIAVIAAGGALLIHGLAVSSRWRRSLGTEALGGAAGVALGILALVGIMPMVLLPVAAIVLGATVLLAGSAHPEIVRSATGFDVLVGAGAAVLGILALLHIGGPLVMTMVAMIAVGAGLLASGGVLATSRFGSRLRRA